MEEHRHDYPDLLTRIAKIEQQTNGGMKAQFDSLKTFQSEWTVKHDADAKEFRTEMRNDIRELVKILSERPCVAHTEQLNNLIKERDRWVGFAIVLIGFIIAGLIAWGSLKTKVDINSQRWERLMEGKSIQ